MFYKGFRSLGFKSLRFWSLGVYGTSRVVLKIFSRVPSVSFKGSVQGSHQGFCGGSKKGLEIM